MQHFTVILTLCPTKVNKLFVTAPEDSVSKTTQKRERENICALPSCITFGIRWTLLNPNPNPKGKSPEPSHLWLLSKSFPQCLAYPDKLPPGFLLAMSSLGLAPAPGIFPAKREVRSIV